MNFECIVFNVYWSLSDKGQDHGGTGGDACFSH